MLANPGYFTSLNVPLSSTYLYFPRLMSSGLGMKFLRLETFLIVFLAQVIFLLASWDAPYCLTIAFILTGFLNILFN